MKYRIKTIEDGWGREVFIQYKFFLFWHYFRDAFNNPYNYCTVEDAKKVIERHKKKRVIQYIES